MEDARQAAKTEPQTLDGPSAGDLLRAGQGRGFFVAVGISLAVHLAVFVAVVVKGQPRPRRLDPEKVVTAELVKLGKPRDKKLLPRLPSRLPQKPANDPVIKPGAAAQPKTQTDKAKPTQQRRAVSLKDRINRIDRMQSAVDRVSNKPDNDGQEDGSPEGKVSSFTEQVLARRYFTQVKAAIMQNFVVPTIIDEDVCRHLVSNILIKVDGNGSIVHTQLEQSSGNGTYDQALLKAIKRTSRLPPPPREIGSRVLNDGILLRAPCKTSR